MSEDDNLPRSNGTAVLLGRRYGDAMNSVPLLLKHADMVQMQPKPRHRALALALMGLAGIMVVAAAFIVSERTYELPGRHVASVPPDALPAEQPKTYTASLSGGHRSRFKRPPAVALADTKLHPAKSIERVDEPRTLATQRDGLPHRTASSIEPYRNGTLAKPLSGEALRLALIEDRRLTREMNKATLRTLLANSRATESSVVGE